MRKWKLSCTSYIEIIDYGGVSMVLNRLRQRIVQISAILELPTEVIAGVPKMELIGQSEFVLEHHNGVEFYSNEAIAIRVNLGIVRVQGSGLYIQRMNSRQIAVYGTIRAIMIEEEAH